MYPSIPGWWIFAPVALFPLAVWKVVDILIIIAHHISFDFH